MGHTLLLVATTNPSRPYTRTGVLEVPMNNFWATFDLFATLNGAFSAFISAMKHRHPRPLEASP